MQKIQKFVPLLLVSVALSACGGGSSDSPAQGNTMAAITETNMLAAASSAYSSKDISAIALFPVAAGVVTQANFRFSIKDFVTAKVREAVNQEFLPIVAAGVVTTSARPCASGMVSESLNDADNSKTLTSGDILTLSFNNCQDTDTAVRLNGSFKVVFTKIAGDGSAGTSYDLDTAFTFDNLKLTFPSNANSASGTLALNGSMVVRSTGTPTETAESLSIPTLTLTDGSSTLAYTGYLASDSLTLATQVFTKTIQGNLSDTLLGGGISISTVTPFQGTTDLFYPRVGQLKIVGANATLTATALNYVNVRLDLDKGNDGSIEASQTVGWGQI